MALVNANRVSQKVGATGTGDLVLSNIALGGFRTVAGANVPDGSTLYYTIEDGAAYECGLATYTSATNKVSRQVLISSNGNAALNVTLNAVFSCTVLVEIFGLYATVASLAAYLKSADAANTYLTQTNAANTYAPLANPTFTGTPKGTTTPAAGDNSKSLATTEYVDRAASGGAPSAVIPGANGATVVAAVADKGKMYVLAGSGVLQLPAAVQVANWYAYIKKNDKVISSWSISPVQTGGAPLIEGLNSISVYQEEFIIFWDGNGFRTANRPKGWIDIGVNSVTTSVAAVDFTIGFADTEIRDIEITAENVSFSASDYASIRLQKGGSFQTSNYIWNGQYYGGSSGNQNQGSYGVNATFLPVCLGTAASGIGAAITAYNVSLTANQRTKCEGNCPANGTISQGGNSAAGSTTGIRFFGGQNGANVTAGAFSQKGFRP